MDDKTSIDELTAAFFRSFSNGSGSVDLEPMTQLFIPQALIVKTCGLNPEIYNLQQFTEPRKRLLNDGSVVGFEEHETSGRTEIFGHIAHRLSPYEKSWVANGERCTGGGVKTIQFIKTAAGWKISALAWDDR